MSWELSKYFSKLSFNDQPLLAKGETKTGHVPITTQFELFKHCDQPVVRGPIVVPPTWNKSEHHKEIENVWQTAASDLAEAENIFVIGYSLPPTDHFFRYLFALGTASDIRIRKFVVFDPHVKLGVGERFKSILGPLALKRYQEEAVKFVHASHGQVLKDWASQK